MRSTDNSTANDTTAEVLWDFDRYLAERLEGGGLTQAEARALEEARERLHRLVREHQGGELAA